MVTAGVYMISRSHVIFERAPSALTVVAVIGTLTAFFAATIGIAQTDIKKVLAYSTVSQLGYMFMACGVGAFSAGIFHLMTHAFFKGLLFLAAGSVIHAVGGEQDMRRMGGLRTKLPWTFWTMTAWDSQESMRRYMTTPPHRTTMPYLLDWCDEASVVHWDQPEDALPSWHEAHRRMCENGRASRVRNPSPQHATLSYPPPRVAASTKLAPRRSNAV